MEHYAAIDVSLEWSSVCASTRTARSCVRPRCGANARRWSRSSRRAGCGSPASGWKPVPCRSGCTPGWWRPAAGAPDRAPARQGGLIAAEAHLALQLHCRDPTLARGHQKDRQEPLRQSGPPVRLRRPEDKLGLLEDGPGQERVLLAAGRPFVDQARLVRPCPVVPAAGAVFGLSVHTGRPPFPWGDDDQTRPRSRTGRPGITARKRRLCARAGCASHAPLSCSPAAMLMPTSR